MWTRWVETLFIEGAGPAGGHAASRELGSASAALAVPEPDLGLSGPPSFIRSSISVWSWWAWRCGTKRTRFT